LKEESICGVVPTEYVQTTSILVNPPEETVGPVKDGTTPSPAGKEMNEHREVVVVIPINRSLVPFVYGSRR
jgi:hypothetical protein